MSNFSAEIFLWAILQLWLNKKVWNYYIHQKEHVGLTVKWRKIIRFKYLILETTYTCFPVFSSYFIVLHTLNFLSPMFVLTTTTFPFNLSFFVFVFATLKKKIFIFKYFWHCSNSFPRQSTLVSQKVFCDYQINLEINSSFEGGRYSIFLRRGRPYMGGLGILLGDLITI